LDRVKRDPISITLSKKLDGMDTAPAAERLGVMSSLPSRRCLWVVDSPLLSLLLIMAAIYLGSLVAVMAVGLSPAVPWPFILLIGGLLVPFAMIFFHYSRERKPVLFDLAVSGLVLLLFQQFFIWLMLAVGVIWLRRRESMQWKWGLLVPAAITAILGYASLWNMNYLLARAMLLTHDPLLRALDERVYGWFLPSIMYDGLFPLVHNPLLLQAFNNAYMLLFPEVALVLLLLCQQGDASAVAQCLRGLFGFYAFGVLCFVAFPAIGPCLYYPESLNPLWADMQLVNGMAHDYHAAVAGGELQGYGYFIAVPSLHVIVAWYLQSWFGRFPAISRVFFPLNIALILSTVVLGYHYIVDVVLALLTMAVWSQARRRIGHFSIRGTW
jgi:hypothetical protein